MRQLKDAYAEQIEDTLSVPWAGEANLVGTMIDRHIVKLTGVGDHTDEAILVFLQAIRSASQTSPLFERLWKTIRDDKAVDLWYYDQHERWRSLSFEVRFERAFPPDDLYMVVSTFIPFGVGGDKSHYQVEQSNAYIRSTQDLRAVVNVHTKRTLRDTSQHQSSSESNRSSAWSKDSSDRDSTTRTAAGSTRATYTNGYSSEDSVRDKHGKNIFLQPSIVESEHTTGRRWTSSNERVDENRWENSSSTASERSRSERSNHEESSRSSESDLSEQVVEVTEDISFTAIGPDCSRPGELLKSWRADPGNAESSMTIDMLLCALPAMSRIIEQGVAHSRMARRSSRAEFDFWAEADRLIARYNPSAYGQRVVCKHDGYMHPIRRDDLMHALESAKKEMPQFGPGGPFLLGGR